MSTGDLLNLHPSELKFPFEVKKQSSCALQLTNKTDKYVAFKVKTTNPKKYCVRPNTGVVSPGASCNVTVTMQAPKEPPADMQCKDKFLVQCVNAPEGATTRDLTAELFNKDDGKVVEEFKLRVIYIPANPPSPVPEESEEGSPPRTAERENGYETASLAARHIEDTKRNSTPTLFYKLSEEKELALLQNQKLRQELELLRKEMSKGRAGGFSMLFVLLVGIIGIVLGYFMKRA